MLQNSTSSSMFPKLFEPGRIGRLFLNNRLIKAPMVTGLATRDGCVTDRMIRYYREVSRGGAALVIVENSHVDNEASKAIPCQLSSSHDEHKSGLSWLAATIKSNGANACLQLGHAGRRKHLRLPPIKAPSRVPSEESRKAGMPIPEEFTFEEIEEIIEAFGDAAVRAKQTGFDMVEIVGCHGYLVTNFLSPLANRRTDWYGGNLKNRMRFLLEVVDNIFRKVGKDFPLSIRLSGSDYEEGGITIEETKKVAVALEGAGVSTIHVSGGSSDTRHMVCASMYGPMATHVWAAEEINKVVNIPIIASGSITTPQLAETIVKQGKADFISLGRPLLADPYFPLKAQEGRPEDIRPCIRCLDGCITRGHAKGFINCTVNAALGKEEEFGGSPASKPRKVAIIGGGPAGMEAARVAALRGHQVTLFEKRKMGGVLIEASVPEFKADIRGLINYLSVQIKKAGVKIVNTEATSQMVKDGQFDAVIVATGATLSGHDVPGIDKPRVVGVLDVFQGAKIGKSVAVIGGGRIGCDAALFLAEQEKKVTITTRGDDIARGMNHSERLSYFERLSKQSVEIRTGVHLEEVTDSGIIVGDRAGSRNAIEVDHVVLASGLTPNRELFDELSKISNLKVYAIGDCAEPRTIFDAIHEAYRTAYNLL
jgi:2,4-dienoyl-CoA reductase-like NADH-dependent reductase (Old Yellow Enzyme family)/thioredoxin reductase